MTMKVSGDLQVKLILGGVVIGLAVFTIWKAKNTVVDVVQSVNPTNPNNIINQGFEALYGGNLGTDIYDLLHDENGNNVLNPFNWGWGTGTQKATQGGALNVPSEVQRYKDMGLDQATAETLAALSLGGLGA